MLDFPLGLRTAIETGKCVLFVGAGLGDHLLDKYGKPAPDSETLAKEISAEFSIEVKDKYDLSQLSKIVEIRVGRPELISFLKKRLTGLEPDEVFKWLFSNKWSAIFTTNYDSAIERAYELIAQPPQNPISICKPSQIIDHDSRFEVPIVHIHGYLFGTCNDKEIIITNEDYARFREPRRMLFDILKTKFASCPVFYIGYSNRDSNWDTLIYEIQSEFYPEKIPQSYRLSPFSNEIQDEILKDSNLTTLSLNLQGFYELASTLINEPEQDSSRYLEVRKEVPEDLISEFEKNPASVTRLISSWEYVTQEAFHDKPNLHSFLRGDKPNWSLVGMREIFERDIEDEIYDDFLDFVTSPTDNSRISIVLGSAGYGKTTLLMTLASRLVKDRVGSVFMLGPGKEIKEGDIEYAVSISKGKPFFFIDDAADFSDQINTIYSRFRTRKTPVYLVLGERLNEWRQSQGTFHINEFIINPLSDPEIDRLIDYLDSKSELGVLSDLNREMQFAIVQRKHKKELLVVLRETTEGKSFDAILEDEYRGISSGIARKMYLTVCCFHQNGVLIRDRLLSKILNVGLADLYEQTSEPTEGVIFFESLNISRGEFAARSRHRIIAQIVWERCTLAGERDEILRNSLAALNLNYGLDKTAFEEFIRSDHTIDQIQTLEGKIRFFETAAKKDPTSPYIRQHYARMLLREGNLELALSQAEEAIKLSPRERILHHTKGIILKSLALTAENRQIGIRRLAQSEDSFNYCLSLYDRDEYSYQGLAQLYREWAEDAPTSEEALEYITKAEDIINLGLKKVKSRESLWIESSEIQSYFRDEPSRITALEKAIEDTPGSIIGRYLLGRAYRKQGKYSKSCDILKYVIQNFNEEFRCFVEYAIALSAIQKDYKEAIANLRQSNLYGLSDPRYIATLGGMLIMEGKISEGNDVFEEALKQNFNSSEIHKIQYNPWNFENLEEPRRMVGNVIVRKAGYALIESESYPPFLTPGFLFNGLILEKGQRILFEPAFSAKGGLALNPILID
jgi:tetratricopeptide (TPR) repeat protein